MRAWRIALVLVILAGPVVWAQGRGGRGGQAALPPLPLPADSARVTALKTEAMAEVEVRCLPDQIPQTIDVDISALEIGDSVHLRDIVAPTGVEFLADADRTICSVVPPAVTAVEEAAPVAVEVAEPEVIGKGKTEEEEGEE